MKVLVPSHLQELHARQNRFCLQVGAEGRGSQIEKRETRTETLLLCLAGQRG